MSNHSLTAQTTEEKAKSLLGAGATPSQVASALGVDPSYISQLLSNEEFSRQVTEIRYTSLVRHNERDGKLDTLEDTLIKKLQDLIPHMYKPSEIIHAFTRINQAKRRGSAAPEQAIQHQTVINLNLPTQILQHFTVNAKNQVIQAGQQELITVQSGRMSQLLSSSSTQGAQNHVENVPKRIEAPTTS